MVRHVLWVLADPLEALRSWVGLLGAGGPLLLVEGQWWSGAAGIPASEAVGMLGSLGHGARLVPLADRRYWGSTVFDQRYLLVATPT